MHGVTFVENSNLQTIGDSAFCYSGLTSIIIPSRVETIEEAAFAFCNSLTQVNIQQDSNLKKIEAAAFEYSGIDGITLSQGIEQIGNEAFRNCESLTFIEIPSSVTNIGAQSFYDCINLGMVCFARSSDDGITSLGSMALAGCSALTTIMVEAKSVAAYKNSFTAYTDIIVPYTPGLTYKKTANGYKVSKGAEQIVGALYIPQNYNGKPVTEIATNAFSGCTSLTSVNLSNGLTSISANAFSDSTSLTSIVIPSSVTVIESNAFAWCSELHTVTFLRTAAQGITQVGEDAFRYCEILATVNLPEDDESGEAYYDSFCENNVNLANAMMGIMLI